MTDTDPLFPGNTLIRTYTFKDENETLYDPTTITVTIIDSSDVVIETLQLADLTRVSVGVYKLMYNLSSTATKGLWEIIVNAAYTVTNPNLNKTKIFSFEVQEAPI